FEDPDSPDKVYKVVKRGKIDQTLFIKKQRGDILLVQVYVDDIIFGSTNKDLCKAFEKLIKDKFQMSLMGELTFFLGLQVKHKQDGIFISQDKYVAKILRKFGLTDGKSASTPLILRSLYLRILMVRMWMYLKGKPQLGLWYPKDSPFNLVAYSDSDYAGASLDRKSTTGGCRFLGCRLISWQCKKQTVVATSSTEAEYVAAASCYAQVLYIQNQLLDYGRKVIITKDTIQQALRLDDAESIDYLPNVEIFAELERMGYEKPSTKLTFYKGFSRVDTPLFDGMLIPHQVTDDVADEVANVVAKDAAEPTPPSPTPATTPPPPQQEGQEIGEEEKVESFRIKEIKEEGKIAKLDANEDVTLEEVATDLDKDAEVQGSQEESQAQVYQFDLEHTQKVLSMQDDEAEPTKLKEVIEVVTTTKLMTEVVTTAATTITAAPSAARRRKGLVIRDPEETDTSSIIVHSEPKYKDKGKGILVKRKEKQDNAVLRYQALKRKPQTEAQAKKNIRVYLKNMVGFKMDFFKGMSYDDIRPIFEKHFNSIVDFLEKEKIGDAMANCSRKICIFKAKELLRWFSAKHTQSIFGVDAVEDFKEYTLRDYYCWYKLKLLDNATDSRLRLLEESADADDKMKRLH
nr:hypothetical protein [Tanacetum cinerariifolium]